MATNYAYRVNVERLEAEFARLKASFDEATPFRYVVIDDFLEVDFARRLYEDYPQLDGMQRTMARLLKARSYDGEFERFGSPFSGYFGALQSDPFRSWLRRLTEIPDLEMDPKLVGGGLHQGARGSSLHVHADHNTHPHDASQYRRINVLFYVNEGWNEAWGGELDLYDGTGSRVVGQVVPAFNRCVIMEVHDRAFHGYEPLRHIPSSVTRKLLASYFYSAAPGALQSAESHPTLYGTPAVSALGKLAMRARRYILNQVSDFGGLRPRPRR